MPDFGGIGDSVPVGDLAFLEEVVNGGAMRAAVDSVGIFKCLNVPSLLWMRRKVELLNDFLRRMHLMGWTIVWKTEGGDALHQEGQQDGEEWANHRLEYMWGTMR